MITTATSPLIDLITSSDPAVRNLALSRACEGKSPEWLVEQSATLDAFRRESDNLYERVRALFFLSSIHRYLLPPLLTAPQSSLIPFEGFHHLLRRRFSEAIETFLAVQDREGPSEAISSALAQAYRGLGFQTLADQVRHSVRTVRGNQWMFRISHPADQPLRLRRELVHRTANRFPVLIERTPVRMDFTHSAWSDIFFLGMDYPDGAQVMNVSVNLGVRGRDAQPKPPIETYLRVIDRPVLRLSSLDLNSSVDISTIEEVFDFARDYLGLLKAAVIAAGVVPPAMEGSDQSLADLFGEMIGPGLGLEIVSNVNDIPKGSRLAVSTNLLGSLISLCMRATGQVSTLQGELAESDRRIVAARAILGEWIGGSGGGWQDSGGVWPGIKVISGSAATEGDPEFGISRGRLLPNHKILGDADVSPATRDKLQQSLIIVHGGMAQNVGPILEMVTEKYLLRGEAEWQARQNAQSILGEVTAALKSGDIRKIGEATTRNFMGPLQAIIPWCTNLYTESLIEQTRQKFGDKFYGFWMLGGMAGGGMGFIVDPSVKAEAQDWLQKTMSATKKRLEHALPFAMEPVVYDFAINDRGTWAEFHEGEAAVMSNRYYAQEVPGWLRSDVKQLSPQVRQELEQFGTSVRNSPDAANTFRAVLERMLPQQTSDSSKTQSLDELLENFGFDAEAHEQIRADYRAGRIGLSQNRISANAQIEDVSDDEVTDARGKISSRAIELGKQAISEGAVAVVSLAAGVGSRWTQGAGVVKALHPYCKLGGRHRNFLETHLAKSRRVGKQFGASVPHVVTTSYMTHAPIESYLAANDYYSSRDRLYLSPGRAIGLRMVPMAFDLQYAWEEMPQQLLDEQQEKVRASVRAALLNWARVTGEGSDYVDNVPMQCLNPVGHWYEFPNMLRNGLLAKMLAERPKLKHLMLHNIDTLGADVDAGMVGLHIEQGNCLSFELIARRLEDRGGGLARVNGRPRILEGLAMPREQDEFNLSYYNSATTWIDIDRVLEVFELTRADLADSVKVDAAVRALGWRMPTYSTLKDVKKRWGHGQEDVFPVAQFEKLWGDMTALAEVKCGFLVVPLFRGQQLKDQAQLDGWLRDGSANYVNARCEWDR